MELKEARAADEEQRVKEAAEQEEPVGQKRFTVKGLTKLLAYLNNLLKRWTQTLNVLQ